MGEGTGQRGLPVPTQRDPIHRNWSSVAPQLALLLRGRPLVSDAVDTVETLPGSWDACLRRKFFGETRSEVWLSPGACVPPSKVCSR